MIDLAEYVRGKDVPLVHDELVICVFADCHGDVAYISNLYSLENQKYIGNIISNLLNQEITVNSRLKDILGKRDRV